MRLPWGREARPDHPQEAPPAADAPPAEAIPSRRERLQQAQAAQAAPDPSSPLEEPQEARHESPRRGGGFLGLGRKRRAKASRKDFVAAADVVWRKKYVKPFREWLEPQIPSSDYLGPGGVRFAVDAVWTLAAFRAEMQAWMDLGLGPPDTEALRNDIALDRRNFEILHRFFVERAPRLAQTWVIPPFLSQDQFWAAFKEAARQFEEGVYDERLWVAGLNGMIALALSWSGVHTSGA